MRWDTEWKSVIPNVAESFEVNADGTEYTFKLREGHKWSDGKPSAPTTSSSGGRISSWTRISTRAGSRPG